MNCPVCGSALAPGTKFCPECGTRLATPSASREVRKTVTVLFADVAGSTALGERLDPESMRALMGRYFAETKKVIEGHGGTVEKFIGDAVMAVFGIPVLHEDDALRAVRAAAEIGERLFALNAELGATDGLAITFRTGLFTGEVVAGDPGAGQTLVTGDTVNTAARLEQAATPGDILLGLPTYRLVRDAVTVEELEPIRAKGKEEPVPAFRLLSVAPGSAGHARRTDTPLVGRTRELQQLHDGFGRAVADRSPQLVTILGSAGIGKSRLVADFLDSISDRASVLKGRCLPYGEGITYWPLREIVHAAAAITEFQSATEAMGKLRSLLDGEPDADLLARRVGAAIGLETEGAPQEEIFWATRKLIEHLARRRPLVTLWEDIHWAEPTLLDLLEYIVDLGADAPLLLLCPARPELVETRAGWGASRANTLTLHLEPLPANAAEQLISRLPGGIALPDSLRERILTAAEGNPLYLEEMLGMLVDEGHIVDRDGVWRATEDAGRVTVPPSVRALLSARIDALPKDERQVAERASVAGRVFEAAAVRELSPDGEGEVGRSLLALVRKELVKPERSELSAGDAFKFRHLLIRDAAYEALPKRERADLHVRFAAWLERAAGERLVEYEEILGYHYELAFGYRTELGESGTPVESARTAAHDHLLRAASNAFERSDTMAASGLLRRAARIAPPASRSQAVALLGLVDALIDLGDYSEARITLDDASLVAAGNEDEVIAARRAASLIEINMWTDPTISAGTALEQLARSIAVFDDRDEWKMLARSLQVQAHLFIFIGRIASSLQVAERAMEAARRAGSRREQAWSAMIVAVALALGPIPASEGILRLKTLLARHPGERFVEGAASFGLAFLHGLRGELEEARAHNNRERTILSELGLANLVALAEAWAGLLELRAGSPDLAEPILRAAFDRLEVLGDTAHRSTVSGYLAQVLAEEGRDDEALEQAAATLAISKADDLEPQIQWRIVRAVVFARRGQLVEAESLAAEAVRIALGTDWPHHQGEALLAQAGILLALGRREEARQSIELAIERLEAKEFLVLLPGARELQRSLLDADPTAHAEGTSR